MNPILYAKIGAAAVLLASVFWGGWHFGRLSYRLADTTAVAKQEAHNEAIETTDAKTINTEAKAYHEAVSATPDPTPALVCVRKYAAPRPVSETAAAGPRDDGAAKLPAPDRPGFDPGPKLMPIGQEADARVIYLQDYIARVCLAN